MSDWLGKLISAAQLPTPFVAAVGGTTGFLLFAPQGIRVPLGVGTVTGTSRSVVGLLFVFSCFLLAFRGLPAMYGRYRSARRRRAWTRDVRTRIERLDPHEQAVLREFLVPEKNTVKMPVAEPVVAGLLSDGVLVAASGIQTMSYHGPMQPLAISPDVAPFLTLAHLDVLEPLSEEYIRELAADRPEFSRHGDFLDEFRAKSTRNP